MALAAFFAGGASSSLESSLLLDAALAGTAFTTARKEKTKKGKTLKLLKVCSWVMLMTVACSPAGTALGAGAAASSSLESSLLELSAAGFAFLAAGPLVAFADPGIAFRFFASGDLVIGTRSDLVKRWSA